MSNFPFRIETLDLDLLDTSTPYQEERGISKKLPMIVENFIPDVCGPLHVTPVNGRFEVWDGQTRLAALRELGKGSWPCVISEVTEDQAAARFVLMHQHSRQMSPLVKHQAQLVEGDPKAIALEKAVKSVGFSIGHKRPRVIEAISALWSIRDRWDLEVLKSVLSWADKAYGEDPKDLSFALTATMLRGMGMFIGRHGDLVEKRPEKFLKALTVGKRGEQMSPKRLMAEARVMHEVIGGGGGKEVYIYLVSAWNRGRPGKDRIDLGA